MPFFHGNDRRAPTNDIVRSIVVCRRLFSEAVVEKGRFAGVDCGLYSLLSTERGSNRISFSIFPEIREKCTVRVFGWLHSR